MTHTHVFYVCPLKFGNTHEDFNIDTQFSETNLTQSSLQELYGYGIH